MYRAHGMHRTQGFVVLPAVRDNISDTRAFPDKQATPLFVAETAVRRRGFLYQLVCKGLFLSDIQADLNERDDSRIRRRRLVSIHSQASELHGGVKLFSTKSRSCDDESRSDRLPVSRSSASLSDAARRFRPEAKKLISRHAPLDTDSVHHCRLRPPAIAESEC